MKNPFTYFKRRKKYRGELQDFVYFEFRPGTHGFKYYRFYLNGDIRKRIPTKKCLKELALLMTPIVKYDKFMDELFELNYNSLTWEKIDQ